MKNLKKIIVLTCAVISHSAFANTQQTPQEMLLDAAYQGNIPGIEQALAQGATINKPDSFGATPLMAISINTDEDPKILSFFIHHGADLQAQDHNGCTARDYALLSFNPKLNVEKVFGNAPRGTNALINAVNDYNIPLMEKLLTTGVNPDLILGSDGTLLLQITVNDNPRNLALAQTLLAHGANPNYNVDPTTNQWGTPLIQAAQGNAPKMVDLLLHYKANVNKYSPLFWATNTPSISLAIIKALIKAGANINYQDPTYKVTPLMNAVAKGNSAVLPLLLQAAANLNLKDIFGHTALDYAHHYNQENCLRILEAAL
jgi:ankyrin repeat protein